MRKNLFYWILLTSVIYGHAKPIFTIADCDKPHQGLMACKALIPIWWWDNSEKVCKSEIFGGCGATANNFPKLEECENIASPICLRINSRESTSDNDLSPPSFDTNRDSPSLVPKQDDYLEALDNFGKIPAAVQAGLSSTENKNVESEELKPPTAAKERMKTSDVSLENRQGETMQGQRLVGTYFPWSPFLRRQAKSVGSR